MTRWEWIRHWIARWIWPEMVAGAKAAEAKIEELEGRLKTTHTRMQDLYWEGKAKEMAYARIEGLEEFLREACSMIPEKTLADRILLEACVMPSRTPLPANGESNR